jgi:hypothetical protein
VQVATGLQRGPRRNVQCEKAMRKGPLDVLSLNCMQTRLLKTHLLNDRQLRRGAGGVDKRVSVLLEHASTTHASTTHASTTHASTTHASTTHAGCTCSDSLVYMLYLQ